MKWMYSIKDPQMIDTQVSMKVQYLIFNISVILQRLNTLGFS